MKLGLSALENLQDGEVCTVGELKQSFIFSPCFSSVALQLVMEVIQISSRRKQIGTSENLSQFQNPYTIFHKSHLILEAPCFL